MNKPISVGSKVSAKSRETEEYQLIDFEGLKIELTSTLSVGRAPSCDLIIADPAVSRLHARVYCRKGLVVLEDMKSCNSTFLNGKPVTTKSRVHPGDVLRFATHEYTLLPTQMADNQIPGCWKQHNSIGETVFCDSFADSFLEVDLALHKLQAPKKNTARLIRLGVQSVTSQIDLEMSTAPKVSVWELGRDQACNIVINDETVSTRHAQLISAAGRWKMVNLVSTNGIYVNGVRKLSSYLGDMDQIQIGSAHFVFRVGPLEKRRRFASKIRFTRAQSQLRRILGRS
ncbi:MAG: FHA domain-containing protein [Pseudomonadales bacterium]